MSVSNRSKVSFALNSNSLLYFLIVILLMIAFFNSVTRSFWQDEIEAFHSAWKIFKGEKIYVDFFQHHHPLFYYYLAHIFSFFGETTDTLSIARGLAFVFFLSILLIEFLIAKMLFNKEIALIGVIFLLIQSNSIFNLIEIRPDILQISFGLLSLLFLFNYFEHRSAKYLILSSLSLSLSFMLLQKAIVLIVIVFSIFLFNLARGQMRYDEFKLYAVVFMISVTPFFLSFSYTGSFSEYVTFNWVLNKNWQLNKFSSVSDNPLITTSPSFLAWVKDQSLFFNFHLKNNPVLYFFYIIGMLFFLKTKQQKILGILSLSLLLSALFYPAFGHWYFLQFLPLVTIISASALHYIFHGGKFIYVLLIILVLSSLFPTGYPSGVLSSFSSTTKHNQLSKINYVLSITDSDDYVYDGMSTFNVYRKDIDFFWFSITGNGALETYKSMTNYSYNSSLLIDLKKPKVIRDWALPHAGSITEQYVRSTVYPELFIRQNLSECDVSLINGWMCDRQFAGNTCIVL